VGVAVAGLHDPGAATADAAHSFAAVAVGAVGMGFVRQRLAAPDHDATGIPFPEAHRRPAPAGTDLISENLIQRHVQTRLARAFVNQLPVEIVPGCAAHDTSSSARATAAATACVEMPYMATSSPSAASSVDVMVISSL